MKVALVVPAGSAASDWRSQPSVDGQKIDDHSRYRRPAMEEARTQILFIDVCYAGIPIYIEAWKKGRVLVAREGTVGANKFVEEDVEGEKSLLYVTRFL